MNKDLRQAVGQALTQGVSRAEIRELLAKGGWTEKEGDEVLQSYVESTKPVALPLRAPVTFAKESYLYFMQVVSYTALAVAFLILWFPYVNLWLPDLANGYDYANTAARDLIRTGMSILIVALPVFLGISWAIAKEERRISDQRQNAIKQGSLYLGAFAASITASITLIVTVYIGLSGETTGRFLLKVLAILLVCAATAFLAWHELRYKRDHAGLKKSGHA